jgi:mannitol operon transcriptional antiterminator
MISLTIQQRNLLHTLLDSNIPLAVADIARQMSLTPRQVSYRLKPVQAWLAQRDVPLKMTPGVGIEVSCSVARRRDLLQELTSQTNFQLILTPGQRQQLFALNLLTANEPVILDWLQYIAAVSRPTVLKDLELLEEWTQLYRMTLVRRPNYGFSLEGPELARRQALAALLWGEIPFEEPLLKMTYNHGLLFSLADDASQLSIVQQAKKLLSSWNTQIALEWVGYAEAQLGGRFTDEAVLHLALTFSIQAHRVQFRHYIEPQVGTLYWLETKKGWPVAVEVFQRMRPELQPKILPAEIAYISMQLLAGTRNHAWPGDLYLDPPLIDLVADLTKEVAKAFKIPELSHDPSLRDGLMAHIIPAVMRQRFGLWVPSSWPKGELSGEYKLEYSIARELAAMVTQQTGVILPTGEIDTLTLLIRAAFIRERPRHSKRVYIVCPSGMATAQLLLARLRPQFPSLEIVGVLSLRELSPECVTGAHFIISTVPLESPIRGLPVIQVHPLLTPKDIETITNHLI